MDPSWTLVAIVAVAALAVGAGVVLAVDRLRIVDSRRRAAEILELVQRDAESLKKSAELEIREARLKSEAEAEREAARKQESLHVRERSLDKRETALEQQSEFLRKQEKMVEATQRKLSERIEESDKKNLELGEVVEQQKRKLHEISGLSADEARRTLLGKLERELEHESGAMIARHQKTLAETCQAQAREILVTSLQRYAASHTAETTTSVVDIPNDEMKGRIIGREGRNIRAFEKATGVDVIIDDTPGVVVVSGFDAVRREVARLSLNKLIADGRIHPSRIEEVVAETQAELETHIMKFGRDAAQEVDVPGLHERVINLLGRLAFRTSYSQNVLRHSIEVAFVTGMMAEELGMDGTLARRAGLLHDIGKAADHEMEGGHPKIGADLLKRFGEREEVVHAALGHHDDLRPDRPYTVLVAAADACSASRPGARRETLERYVKRLQDLEAIAHKFEGVEQAYAIQAGRELRVIASARNTNDASAAKIARDIAKAVEEQLTYPGEIKVTVLREIVFTETAK
ncbi:MAG TPA: ribonuclease Y [Pirellulales bacterium]